MRSITSLAGLALLTICASSAQADQSPTSIDAGTCLSQSQRISLEAAAEKDDLIALRRLRLYYFSCAGDRAKLLAISKRAADIGVASDVESYASAVEDANGMSKAFPIFLKSAQMGDPLSQFTVATAYRDGNGVSKDSSAALMWFELGSNCHGHAEADWGLINMRNLAEFLLADKSVQMAKLKGIAWLNVLANSRAGLSEKEDASRKAMIASLSQGDASIVSELTDEFSDQAGCTSTMSH